MTLTFDPGVLLLCMEALFWLGQRGSVGLVFSYGEKKVRENAALSFGVERRSSYRHSHSAW